MPPGSLPRTEAQLQSAVIALAQALGWRVAHFRTARTRHGWRTPVAADGNGFPDLVLVRERVIFAELKGAAGRLSAAQEDWGRALDGARAAWCVWRPTDWESGEIARQLGNPAGRG